MPGPGKVAPNPDYDGKTMNQRPVERTALHHWCVKNGVSRAAFARKLGCTPNMVSFWCDGKCVPSLVYAFAIEKVTKGDVAVAMWLAVPQARRQWEAVERNGHG